MSAMTPLLDAETCLPGSTLEWSNVCYRVNSGSHELDVLRGAWGRCKPHRCTALLGSSGAGKTSLLNLLAGRAGFKKINHDNFETSVVAMNGIRKHVLWPLRGLSFVEQEDALWATSTVREAIWFSARMRLDVSDEIVDDLVEETLGTMGLEKVMDSLIGNPLETRGISGGERKRVAIAIELISKPTLLLADEPTSGLDSLKAFEVVRTMKNLSRNAGCTVLSTIHQPSSETFFEFDDVIILAKGRTVYCGPTAELADFFSKACDMPIPEHYNPADFAIAKVDDVELSKYQSPPDHLLEYTAQLTATYDAQPLEKKRTISTFRKLVLLTKREIRSVLRNVTTLRARFGMVVGLNLVLGLVLHGAGKPADMNKHEYLLDVQAHFAVLTLLSTGGMISMSNPIALTFPLERPVLSRELTGGFFKVPVYFISKSIVESIVCAIQTLLTITLVYFLVDLQGDFFLLCLVLWGLGMVASSVALLISASVDSVKTAVSFNPVLIVPQLLFAGFVVPVTKIPVYLKVFTYVSQLRYAIALFVLVEFKDDPSATYIKDENEIKSSEAWIYVLILVANFVIFRGGAMYVLWRRQQSVAG